MNRTLLAIMAACLFSIPAHAQSIHVAGWDVQPIGEGSTAGCMMTADYQDGTRVGIMLMNDYSWGLSLFNASWGLERGKNVKVVAFVDNRPLASGSADVVAPNLALLELKGASAYRALQAGHKLELYTDLGEVRFSLTGTAKAMSAVLGCVGRMNGGDGTRTASQSPSSEDTYAVSGAEAAVLITNMFNAASIRDYKLLPPNNNANNIVYFTMADGSLGSFFAFRGKDTPSADKAIGYAISKASTDCKGDYLFGKQSVPSTDGSVIRKAVGTCREGGTAIVTETTIIRRESGLLLTFTQSRPEQANLGTASTDAPSNGGSGLIDAALTIDEPR